MKKERLEKWPKLTGWEPGLKPGCLPASIASLLARALLCKSEQHLQREGRDCWSPWKWRLPFWNLWQRARVEAWVSLKNRVLYHLVKHDFFKNVYLLPVILSLPFLSSGCPLEISRKQHPQVSSWLRCWEMKTRHFSSIKAFLNIKEGIFCPWLHRHILPGSFFQTVIEKHGSYFDAV